MRKRDARFSQARVGRGEENETRVSRTPAGLDGVEGTAILCGTLCGP